MTRATILSIFGSTLSLVLGHSATALAQAAQSVPPAPAAVPASPPPPRSADSASPPAPIAPAPPPPAGATAPQAGAPAPTRRAVVVFQADQPEAVLESDAATDGKTSPWYVVCQSPCEKDVLATGNFRVAGPGFYPSRQFVIPPDRDRAVVNAEMKESSVAVPMTLCLVGYGLFSVVAPTLLIIGVVQEAEQRDGDAMFVAAGVTALAGAAMGTAGLVMLIVHAQDKESRAYVAKKQVPRVTLPAGFALETRGVVF